MIIERVCGHSFLPGLLSSSPVVLDLGANRGDFTSVFVERYGARVIAVEPNPALSAGLAARGAAEVVRAAVAPQAGTVAFAVDANDESSTIMEPGSGSRPQEIEVEAVTLTDLLRRSACDRIDLVKLDIEGAEILALGSVDSAELQRIDQLTIEFHDSQGFTPPTEIRETCRAMRAAGFDPIRMSVRHWGDVLFVRRTRWSRLDRARVRWIERPRQIAGRLRDAAV